jgi:hypothetical protein
MLNDSLKANGVVYLKLLDAAGNLKELHTHNIVVSTGLAYIASRMKDTTQTVMSHMAIGSGTGTAGAADLALGTQLARQALDSTTIVTQSVTNDTVQYVATFAAGVGTGAVTEAGVFNDPTGGTMLCRTVFAVINKGALDTLVITWKVTVA